VLVSWDGNGVVRFIPPARYAPVCIWLPTMVGLRPEMEGQAHGCRTRGPSRWRMSADF
jgi:hypothetical protein